MDAKNKWKDVLYLQLNVTFDLPTDGSVAAFCACIRDAANQHVFVVFSVIRLGSETACSSALCEWLTVVR